MSPNTLTCLVAQGFQVCAHVAVRAVGQLQQLGPRERVRDLAEQLLQDVQPVLSTGHSHLDLSVESSGSAERSIQGVRAVCGPEDQHLSLTSFLTK